MIVANLALCAVLGLVQDAGKNATHGAVKALTEEKEQVGKMAQDISKKIVNSAVDSTFNDVRHQLGKDGDGPLSEAIIPLSERIGAAVTRGVMSELQPQLKPIPYLLGFIGGLITMLLLSTTFMLIVLLLQNRNRARSKS